MKRVIWNHNHTRRCTPVRCRTAAVRARKVVGGMIGVCSITRLLAQLRLAAENGHFKERWSCGSARGRTAALYSIAQVWL